MLQMEELGMKNPKRVKNTNPVNIYRAANCCDIHNLSKIGKIELYNRYKPCKEQTRQLMAKSLWIRQQFLSQKLTEAVAKQNTKKA